jgi:hypothetical protein
VNIFFASLDPSLSVNYQDILVSTKPRSDHRSVHAIEKDSVRWVLMAALFVGLGSFSSTLLLVLTGVWMLVFVGYIFITGDWPRPSLRVLLWFGMASFLLVLSQLCTNEDKKVNLRQGKYLEVRLSHKIYGACQSLTNTRNFQIVN